MIRMLLRGLAYIGLCILTVLMWLPMRYFAVATIIALPFEIQWTARAIDRGDIPAAALFAATLIGTILFVSSMVWLRAWIMRTWDEMTGVRWIWKW